MESLLFAGIVIICLVALAILVISQNKITGVKIEELKKAQQDNQALSIMQQQIGQLTQQVNQQLQNVAKQMQTTTGQIGDRIADVKKDLGTVQQATKQVFEVAKNISQLEELLRAPKFRGGLGELFLGDLLSQILPPANYQLQYPFKSGEKVDAVIKIGNNLVPIDSKFPLENFRKSLQAEEEKEKMSLRRKFVSDVKNHIDDIARKYILPDEGTFDFALMYIPAENVYYETIIRDEALGQVRDIFAYSMGRRVIPVSPNSLYAYLQVIVLGLKGLRVEKAASEITQSLARLEGDLNRFREDFEMIGTHLSRARSKYDEADKKLTSFSDKLLMAGQAKTPELPEQQPGT